MKGSDIRRLVGQLRFVRDERAVDLELEVAIVSDMGYKKAKVCRVGGRPTTFDECRVLTKTLTDAVVSELLSIQEALEGVYMVDL